MKFELEETRKTCILHKSWLVEAIGDMPDIDKNRANAVDLHMVAGWLAGWAPICIRFICFRFVLVISVVNLHASAGPRWIVCGTLVYRYAASSPIHLFIFELPIVR